MKKLHGIAHIIEFECRNKSSGFLEIYHNRSITRWFSNFSLESKIRKNKEIFSCKCKSEAVNTDTEDALVALLKNFQEADGK